MCLCRTINPRSTWQRCTIHPRGTRKQTAPAPVHHNMLWIASAECWYQSCTRESTHRTYHYTRSFHPLRIQSMLQKKGGSELKNCAHSFVETRHGHFMNWLNGMRCFCKSHQGNCMLGKMHALSTLIHHIHRKNWCWDAEMVQYNTI